MLFVSAAQFVSAVRARQLKEFVPAVYVRPENTVADVIHKLAFLKLHRLFVVDEKKFPIGVCSQSTVLNFLAQKHVGIFPFNTPNLMQH
jgi:CBS-domain-containing membrane protein